MSDLSRYHRQMLLPAVGQEGQRKLRQSRVLLVGCGALGSVIADALTRAGIGTLVIVDRDFVELSNLQRQVLFDESDAAQLLPKAEAARRKLAAVNSQVVVEAVIADFNADNAERLAAGARVIVDGTDNFQTRFLLNDLAVKHNLPCVYGGAVGTAGTLFTILPGAGPCLRCLFEDAPSGGGGPTCDTAGVLGPLAATIANQQAVETLKILLGDVARVNRKLRSIDAWANSWREIDPGNPVEDCPCCGQRRFEYLEGARGASTVALCGRGAVQVNPAKIGSRMDFKSLADRLSALGPVQCNPYILRATVNFKNEPHDLTLFIDGRAIVHGTADLAAARAIYDRYVGG